MASNDISGTQLRLPGWTDEEIATLSEAQRVTSPPPAIVREPTLAETPTRRPSPRTEQASPYHAYVANVGTEDAPDAIILQVDDSLLPPRFDSVSAELWPTVALHPVEPTDGRSVEYYFEFDTVDTFDSPNFWRSPQLIPFQA